MRVRIVLNVLVCVGLLFLFAGCSSNDGPATAPGADDGGQLDLESSFGGYNMSDEEVGFGDPELMKNENDGVAAEDAFGEDPAVLTLGADANTDVYSVRLTWGMLEYDSSVTDPTDWSGSIALAVDGAIVVERLIRFEPEDHIVRPRTDRKLVELVSSTAPGLDGVLLTLFDPRGDVAAKTGEVNELKIRLGDFEVNYLLTDLDSLDEVIDVGTGGNQFAIHAFLVKDYFCPRGFLSGKWMPTGPDRGIFRGRWTSRFGLSHGFLKGHWGVNEEGNQVFFGKYIGRGGEFRGLLRGVWDHAPDRAGGTFHGNWHGRNSVAGALRGVWSAPAWAGGGGDGTDAASFDRPAVRGFFQGEWRANCDASLDPDGGDSPPADPAGGEEASATDL